ncbi:MAG: Gfo/Idh/MocA family oxidoreductase [Armatimonadetes bacterium]|nr:Gfo/Idh/MocA family oxidoreductase [Armatimonadota bacterium]
MKTDKHVSRREFLKQSAVVGGIALLGGNLSALGANSKSTSPNERINVGVIGCGGMGNAHINALLALKGSGYPVEIIAVCDVYQPRLNAAASRTGGMAYQDYRKLLERKDIDAVTIATPDHWHSRMAVDAADAGKDVYCEKPMTHWRDLQEAKDVVDAIARNKRVMQVGTQYMSSSTWEEVNERIRAGAIGKLIHAQASDMRNGYIGVYDPNANDGQADPSKNLDWKMWLGPAKKRPWEPGRFFAFRSFWDYSGGIGTDFFPHSLTPLIRAMGLGFPKRVIGTGGQYQHKDGREIPDIFTITAEYPEGPSVLLVASLATNAGLPWVIRGYEGTINLDINGAVIEPQKAVVGEKRSREEIKAARNFSLEEHFRDFLECIRSRQKPRSHEILGYQVMTVLHMGVRSYKEGKVTEFDQRTEQVRPV